VDKSAERREDGRLFQILAPATAKLRSPNVLLVRRTTNIADMHMHQTHAWLLWYEDRSNQHILVRFYRTTPYITAR